MSEMTEDKATVEIEKKDSVGAVADQATTSGAEKKKSRGILSKIWKGIFRAHGDDFEKRLQNISKEESVVLSRLKRRSQTWQKMSRNLILFSLLFEIIAVGYAIVTTRSVDLDWKMRAFRVLPMFLLPALSALTYSSLMKFTKMRDRKDQKTLERLRSERQAKIDELKERTNYYITQQLIQKYDSDPAAKAAAASVLASKLGAEAGLKVFLEDESKLNVASGKSNDVELMQSSGLRSRKQVRTKSNSLGGSPWHQSHENTPHSAVSDGHYSSELTQLVVNHQNPQTPDANNGGWIARIAALLVGEDPTQSYALICGNCHMHNGLAKREDFPYITYYCPHCNALNRPKQSEEQVSHGSSISSPGTVMSRDGGESTNDVNLSQGESAGTSNLPAEGGGTQPDAGTKNRAADVADQITSLPLSSVDE